MNTGASMTKEPIEAAVFRRLLSHLDSRKDVQNIDLMNLAGVLPELPVQVVRGGCLQSKALCWIRRQPESVFMACLMPSGRRSIRPEATAEQVAQFNAGSRRFKYGLGLASALARSHLRI
jgi:hypothetical protein